MPLHIAVFPAGIPALGAGREAVHDRDRLRPGQRRCHGGRVCRRGPDHRDPSGILADRWSRRGVLIISSAALMLCALIGGLSNNVATYIVSALVLGVYFAMYSGTMDAVVYDTVLEETGDSDAFERRIGRVRLVESVALVISSLARRLARRPDHHSADVLPDRAVGRAVHRRATSGSANRSCTRPRRPPAAAAISRRPTGPLTERRTAAPDHRPRGADLAVLPGGLRVRSAVAGRAAVPAVLYGPYWAGLMSTLGLGGLLAGQAPARPAGAAERSRRADDPGQPGADRADERQSS